MNKKYLLSSVTAGIALLYANHGTAQCVTTQDCTALGYTETSCPNGGVKCPFGNKWFCGRSDEQCMELACDKLGFKYDCTGTGYAGGSGSTCNGKYSYCICSSGYKWQLNKCQTPLTGAYGELYFCEGTVVGVRALEMDFFIAMNDLGKMSWHSADSKSDSYSFCGSSQEGFLPNKDQLMEVYNNKALINSLLSIYGGTQLTEDGYWSSSYQQDNHYYYVRMSEGRLSHDFYGSSRFVRPIRVAW